MTTTVVTSKGQVVIPSKIRKKLNIKRGTRFYVEEQGDSLVLKPVNGDYFQQLAGILNTGGKLTRALLEERAREREREK